MKTKARMAVDTFLVGSGAPVSVADVLARYGRPLPSAGEALLPAPAGAGGGAGGSGRGGAKGAANEDTLLVSLERAANAVLALVADNGGGNPYHDKLGRFTTGDGAVAPGSEDAAGSSAFDKGGWGSGSGTPPPSDKVPADRPAGSTGETQGQLTPGPEREGLGWGLHQPDFWDKVGSVLYPGYQAAKRHKAWLLAKYGAPALSREVLQALPGLATEEYMRGYEQLGDKVNDPQAVQALQARYLAQMNGALHLHADVARTEKTIAKPALDAIEMMGMVLATDGLAALDGPALGAGLRSHRESAVFTRSPETAETAPGRVSEAPAQPEEAAPTNESGALKRSVEVAPSNVPKIMFARSEEVQQILGRTAEATGEDGPELFSRTGGKAMDPAEYAQIKKDFESRTGHFIIDDQNAVLELDRIGQKIRGRVEGWTAYKNIIYLRPGASRSAVFEELIHAEQLARGMNRETEWLQMEIQAKEKLIEFQKQYKISNAENTETVEQLKYYMDLQSKLKQRLK